MSEKTISTQVDLGDDLLQTRTVLRPDQKSSSGAAPDAAITESSSGSESPDELLLNAKILMSEGLYEDAKKTLRKVMRIEPGNLGARDRLEEIQKIEIKKMLGGEEAAPSGYRSSRMKGVPKPDEASAAVLASLEKELGPSEATESELFPNDEAKRRFIEGMDVLCENAGSQDRLDLGIAFLEMELFEAAIRQFEVAARDPDFARKARGLLATTLLAAGRPFDAMIEVETLVADQSIAPEEKLDYGYLGGRAQEALGNHEAAARWFRAVLQIENHYRDSHERLQTCLKKCASTRS